jgi:hypothetical protein
MDDYDRDHIARCSSRGTYVRAAIVVVVAVVAVVVDGTRV